MKKSRVRLKASSTRSNLRARELFHSFEIDEASWVRAKRIYLLALAALVITKGTAAPVLSAPPILETLLSLFKLKLDSTSQIFALQILAFGMLIISALKTTKLLALTAACTFYALFILSIYSTIYVPKLNYLPHTENIHFFILLILAVQAYSPTVLTAQRARRCIFFLIGWSYFASFVIKMMNVGPDWAFGETLVSSFANFWMYNDNPVSLWFASNQHFTSIAGLTILVFECFALPMLFIKKVRWFVVAVALTFHLVVWLTLGINFFWSYAIAYVFMWDRFAYKVEPAIA